MVDQLAEEFVGQPVVFIEDYAPNPQGDRISRFWGAHGYGTAYYPMVMVDSGHQYRSGYSSDLYNIYRSYVETEMARSPQAEITAVQTRVGSRLQFDVTVKNLSGVSLSASANRAAVHVLVYEDIHAGVTSRYMRAAPYMDITTPLANNATSTYQLQTDDLAGVDWSRLHAVALVDYRPGGSSGPWDMLQAAFAVDQYLVIGPASFTFMVDSAHPVNKQQVLEINGAPAGQAWMVTENIPWLVVTPASGVLNEPAAVQVIASALSPGWQQGTLRVTVAGPFGAEEDITVNVYLGNLEEQMLPLILNR